MPQQKQPEEMSRGQALNLTGHLSSGLAFLTVPFINYGFGKNYPVNSLMGGVIAVGAFIVMFPRHERVLTAYAVLWSMAICLQIILAHFKHYFGTRELTTFCGYPLINIVFPFWVHFTRRVLNPLLTYGIGLLINDRALALLFKASAIGQFVMYTLMYMISQADDDAKSDATRR